MCMDDSKKRCLLGLSPTVDNNSSHMTQPEMNQDTSFATELLTSTMHACRPASWFLCFVLVMRRSMALSTSPSMISRLVRLLWRPNSPAQQFPHDITEP